MDVNAELSGLQPGGGLGNAVAGALPLVTQAHGDLSTQRVGIPQVIPNISPPTQSGLGAFINKVGAIGSEAAHITEGVGHWVAHTLSDMAMAPIKFTEGTVKFGTDAFDTWSYGKQADALTKQMQDINHQYQNGQLNAQEYHQAMKEWQQQNNDLTQKNAALGGRIGKDANTLIQGEINTAGDIITLMTGGTTAGAVDAASARAADFLTGDAARAILQPAEQAVSRIAVNKAAYDAITLPGQSAVKDAIFNTLFKGTSNITAPALSRAAAANLLLKYPLTFNYISSTGKQVYEELQNKKYGSAVNTLAFNAALALSGGPIGYALKKAGQGLSTIRNALFGETNFIDAVSKITGISADEIRMHVTTDEALQKNFGAMAATNIAAEGGNVNRAAQRFVDGLTSQGWDVASMSAHDLVHDPNNWAEAARLQQQKLISRGMTPEQAARYTVGRWTSSDKNFIARNLSNAAGTQYDASAALAKWNTMKTRLTKASYVNNASLDRQITSIIKKSTSAEELKKGINRIETQVGTSKLPKSVQKQLAKLGFVEIMPSNIEAPFKETIGDQRDFFGMAAPTTPVLGFVGDMLTGAGLSPQQSAQRIYDVFTRNFSDTISVLEEGGSLPGIKGVSASERADEVMHKLSDYANQTLHKVSLIHPPITDLRQLTTNDIAKALSIDRTTAHTVKEALSDAYLRAPLEVRGLGDRLLDINYRINPAAGYYARLQGALRYAYNPIFQARLGYKAEFLAQFETGGKFPTLLGTNTVLKTIMPNKYAELDSIGREAERRGIFGSGYANEAADEQAAGYGQLGHEVTLTQKRAVSSMISTMSSRMEMTPAEFMDVHPAETKDIVRMILQYDPRSSFLNSPMARTLNIAFFPFRFNLKVSTIMARSIARQPLGVQLAVIHGLFRYHQWANSPEGMAWYSKNSDVIGLFKYFSPLETLSSISQALSGLEQHEWSQTVGAFGELGGLPFGFIPGLLQSEGLINTQTPYVNPTTGAIAKDYVPITARGKAKAAIEDLIGAIWTYPGSTVGLTSKTKVDTYIANALVPGGSTKKDFQMTTPAITPQQQEFQQVVQQANNQKQTAQLIENARGTAGISGPLQTSPDIVGATSHTPGSSTLTTPLPKKIGGSGSGKKKKAQETPFLMPGQAELGVIPGAQ